MTLAVTGQVDEALTLGYVVNVVRETYDCSERLWARIAWGIEE